MRNQQGVEEGAGSHETPVWKEETAEGSTWKPGWEEPLPGFVEKKQCTLGGMAKLGRQAPFWVFFEG